MTKPRLDLFLDKISGKNRIHDLTKIQGLYRSNFFPRHSPVLVRRVQHQPTGANARECAVGTAQGTNVGARGVRAGMLGEPGLQYGVDGDDAEGLENG